MRSQRRAWMPLLVAAACVLQAHSQYIRQSCGADDFRCDSGKCIEGSRRCNRVVDCPNEEDERNCECTSEEFKCLIDGTCIESSKRCNGVYNCRDGSDELECATGYFKCRTGQLIPDSLRCNRRYDCPNGDYSDEQNCRGSECPPDKFTCYPPSSVTCAIRCNGIAECDEGEDEGGCPGCNHECDGKCLPDQFICDSKRDCSNGSDEMNCDNCDELNDFRCDNGDCIHIDQRCNNINDCPDGEDERGCNDTMIPTSGGCSNIQFKCHDGTCIDSQFFCDGSNDCYDNSDEENCPCDTNSWQCRSGQCIPFGAYCDGTVDCDDRTDEINCTIRSTSNLGTTTTNPNMPNARPDFYAPPGQKYPYGSGTRGDPSQIDDSQKPDLYDPYGKWPLRGPSTPDPQGWPGYPGAGSGPHDVTTQNPNVGGEVNRPPSQFGGDGNNPYENSPSTNQPYPDDGSNVWPQYGGNRNDDSGNRYPGGEGTDQSENGYPDNNNNGGGDSEVGSPYVTTESPRYNPGRDEYTNRGSNGQNGDENGAPDRDPYGSDSNRGPGGDPYENAVPTGGEYRPDGNRGPGGGQYGSDGGNTYENGEPDRGQPDADGNGSPDRDQYGENGGGQYGGDEHTVSSSDQYGGGGGDPYGNRAPSAGQYGGDGNTVPGGDEYGGRGGDQYGENGGDQYGGDVHTVSSSDQYGGGGGDPYGNRVPSAGPYGGDGNTAPGGDEYGGRGGDQYGNRAPGGGQNGGDENTVPGGDQYGGGAGGQNENRTPGGSQYGGDGNGQAGNSQYGAGASKPYGKSDEDYNSKPQTNDGNGLYAYNLPSGIKFGSDISGGPSDLALRTVPNEQVVRYGGDAVFQCRDEGRLRVPVRWIREGGRPLKTGSIDRKGRLELYKVTPSDSGVYICQAVRFTGYPGSEVRVTLNVEPQAVISYPSFKICKPYEATCGNGRQCIPKSATCDGKIDCSDGSDEDSCYQNGMCEPNQYQCKNHKCVLKTWLCDSQDDCGDNSDEEDCNKHQKPGDPCLSVEFACHTGGQCVPKSFHCDKQPDCFDNSDEIGCAPIYVTQPPKPSLVTLEVGATLKLTCQAVGLPVPLISWRLNWGHVPPQCEAISENGTGTLICPNMQHVHSGAYSCEAINNIGTTFAIPDSIVFVNKSDPCPPAYFNSEARTESECIRCFCFGKSQTCHSADLFLYNMPTPLGQGGTRLVGVSQVPSGDVRTDTPIGNQYHYEPQRNGARVTKMDPSTSSWSVSEDHPYVTLPESYNGKQLTSYGGHIKYVVTPHSDDYSPDDSVPNIIIKGKYGNLFHYHRGPVSREIQIEARLTPENWVKPSPRGIVPASREDIMMTLDHIEMILLRADLNNAGVIINEFTMESAHSANVGLGAASLVEECSCPRGYDGLSCEKCAFGFTRTNSDPWHGDCVPESCPLGTYGDPENGVPCSPCPCPLTSRSNQFASTCSLGPSGIVVCNCHPGYEGDHCERCAPGYVGNPLIPGDSCKPKRTDNCNTIGTRNVRLPDECVCKDNVQGRYCDTCKNDSFHLSEDSRHGCSLCFCSGVSQDCRSSNLRRKTTAAQFNMPQMISEVKIYKSTPTGPNGVRYTAPTEYEYGADSLMSTLDRSPTVYYWSLPNSFSGDKVTSYGGYLKYTLQNVPEYDSRTRNSAADVQLISDNQLTFHYSRNFTPTPDGVVDASIQMVEKEWRRSDGKEISREHFLLALADVKTILIKVRYSDNAPLAMPVTASIETAEDGGNGPTAPEVEQCVCPTGYLGTSCEDCAPGYTRSSMGLYLKLCRPCECNGHSNMCNPETGACYSCTDNTAGTHCELCKPGFQRDPYGYCVESDSTTLTPCRCDPSGTLTGCDGSDVCTCKQNVEGEYCDRCRPGAFGLRLENREGCLSCYCSGVTTECHEGSHFTMTPMAAPIFSDNYNSFKLMDLNAKQVISDNYVPVPNESELTYVFPFPPDQELYWSLPVFPGNRVLSYGGFLSLRQSFFSTDNLTSSEPGVDVVLAGRDTSLYWKNPTTYNAGGSLSYQVPISENGWYVLGTPSPVDRNTFMRVLADLRRVLVRATVSPNILYAAIADVSMDTAMENSDSIAPVATGVEVCMCPAGYTGTSCETCAPLYYKDRNGYCVQCPCNGHECQLDASGSVYCNCRPPYAGSDCSVPAVSQSTQRPRPPVPQTTVVVTVTSPTINILEVGSSVNFTCSARSLMTQKPLRIKWSKVAGQLPLERSTVDELAGFLLITNLQISDSGQYACETNDGVSTAQAIATLKVPGNEMTMPVVEIRPPVNDYYVGDKIELDCLATGTPMPRISWQRASNYPLPAGAEHYENMFIIESAREEDSGEYRCIASNTLGSVDRTAIITVRPKPSWTSRERLTISPASLTLPEGQSSRVVCTGTKLIPADTIDWIRQDGYPLSESVRSISGVLYITSARLEDQGVYLCQSSYPGVTAAQIVLTIEPQGTPAPGSQPNITVSTDGIKIPTGETGTVDCTPSGYPSPSIRWKKYDGDFGPSTSQRGNTLIVNNAQEDDRGYYMCEGLVDGRPIAATYVFIDIEKREAPRVEIWPQGEQSVPIGSQFEFQCRTTSGVPEPALTWARGGSNRPLSPHTHIRPNILQFDTVDVNDEGEYTCSATNVAGTASASAILKVRSPPEITITPSNQQEVRVGEPATFECRANGYPEPTVSIKTGRDMLEIVRPTLGIAVLRITSASERDEGLYTCTATSPAGTIQEQFNLVVDRGDGGYTGIEGSGDEEYEPMRPQQPDLEPPHDLYVVDGQPELTIICNVTGGLQARWGRVEQPLQRNAIERGSTLYIYNVSSTDSGRYVCNLLDVYTGAVVKAVYTSLVVIGAPKITLRPQAQIVRPGQSPTVECVVEGDNIIDIQWKPYNRAPSSRVEIRGSTLIFHQIEVEDAGKYECFARNQYANTSSIAEVVVSEESDRAPSQSHDNEQYAHSGAAVHLSCNVTLPNARIHWKKDGRQVPRSQQKSDGSLFIKLAQKSDSGRYVCTIRDQYGRRTSNYINLHIEGPREYESEPLVTIEQPRRRFRVSENVEVICRAKGFNLRWERYGTNQYVDSRPYGDGSVLIIHGVQESDAGVYRCIGSGPYGTHYDDFNLEVEPSYNEPVYPDDRSPEQYSAQLRNSVDLPCYHTLEAPVVIEWKREFTPLPADIRSNQPNLHLESVTEADAGIYVCRVTNQITTVETRTVLRVEGVVPRFDGSAWLSLPALKDSFRQFDIEISFNPADRNGLILYNSQNAGRTGDYIALSLVDGVPRFTLDSGEGSIFVDGDRPLQLNVWHTIRISRINSRLTMEVDNTGPFIKESREYWAVLELQQPMYIGGVPDYNQLPDELAKYSGFIGCVSRLVLGNEEKNMMLDRLEEYRVGSCNSCSPNQCLNSGVCQEASNERGFMCICAPGFAGLNCDRTGEACRAGLCGPGKCSDTIDGYKCACPVAYTGKNCEEKQSIEYPAFTGSAYLAIKPPVASRTLKMSMKVKPTLPVSDGIIMYCAETPRGHGGFTSLAVRNGKLEFRYDIGRGNNPVVLTSNKTLPANEWTAVQIARLVDFVSLKINLVHNYESRLDRPGEVLYLETPMFVGGVDDSIVLNNNTGVTGGFSGCIRDVMIYGEHVDIVNSSIQSANVRECINERGDIPDTDVGCQCYNGGRCPVDSTTCICPIGFTGRQCEARVAPPKIETRMPSINSGEPCSLRPCRNGGTCRSDLRNRMNHTCDCPLGYAGASCQMPLELQQSVGFNGNGYVELPERLLRYNLLERGPAVIALAIRTYNDGVLLYQREVGAPIGRGDYILLHVVEGFVGLEWDLGSGASSIVVDSVNVRDGDRHQIIAELYKDNHVTLSVDGNRQTGMTTGISNLMSADSNIYIGGIPDSLNLVNNYPGLIGCIEQIELMGTDRGINIGKTAVAGRNAQLCRGFNPGRV